MDDMETPCKRIKLHHEAADSEEIDVKEKDIFKMTQPSLGKNDLIGTRSDNKLCEEPSAFQDSEGKQLKSMESPSSATHQQTLGTPSAKPDESEASEMDEQKASEMDHLREFQVLDEVADDEKKDSDDNNSDSESEQEVPADGEEEILDIPEDEIEQMLEENLPDSFKGQPKPKPRPYGQRKKLVLEEKGINHFEVLPLDWIVLRHMSGMPIYLHRPTRVCTLAKPYFLGKASARKNEIPISAIPCLNYRRALEEEEKQKDTHQVNGETENVSSDKSSSSQCPFSNEQSNSNSEFNLTFKVDSNSTNDSAQNAEQIRVNNENGIISTNGDLDEINGNISNNVINNDSSTNLTIPSPTKVTDREIYEDPIINGKTKVSSCTNSPLATGESNVDSKSVEKSNKTDGNTGKNDATAKPVGIHANITIVGDKKVLPGGIILPNVQIETASQDNWKNKHLAHEQVTEYCKKLFHFRTINIMRFEQWSERRKYAMAKKTMQRPTLPEGTKLITIPAQPAGSGSTGLGGRPGQKEWVMNPNGRSYVCIFHEYVQRVLQKKPTYEFVQLENAATPYKVTVYLNDMQYGVGYGTSKRQAKSMAAKASIEVLIPEMRDKVTEDSKMDGVVCRSDNPDFAFFDFVTIDDPRIAEFCAKTMEPSPHAILQTCLLRNFGVGSQEIKYETKPLKRQRIEFTMTVGKHTATVVCKKKKDGKQQAAQAILQALHPHIKSWGSLLRLYGSRSLKSFKEKKIEEQEITLLQGKAMVNTPNYAILNKLKAEMERLRERDTAVVPIGTLVVTDSLPTHSGSNLDNVEI